MPIELLTGKPGNAKTAFLVDRMLVEKEKPNPRHIVAMGINGLVPGLADDVIDDPTKWAEVIDRTQGPCNCALVGGDPIHINEDGSKTYPAHTHRIPPGALIFIDEAWKWFGHLQDARGQQTPKHALDLAEHRHMGVDFVWTAQGPNQIYPFVRNLIADHTHHVRRFGTQFVDTFKWEELQEDVKSDSKRAASLSVVKVIPKRTFGLYKSAQQHTITRKLPLRLFLIPAAIVSAVLFGYLAFQSLKPESVAASVAMEGPDSALAEPAPGASGRSARERAELKYADAAEYTEAHLPRFASMPHTAPVFDGRGVTSDPQLFCMASKPGINGSGQHTDKLTCTCLTEQGTKYDIEDGHCMRVARWGTPYNPYKERNEDRGAGSRDRPGDVPSDARRPAPVIAGVEGAGGAGGRPAAYGAMRAPQW